MRNLDKILALLNDDLDGILLTSSISRMYSAQFCVEEGVCIISHSGCRYITDSRYIETAQKNLRGFEVQQMDRNHSYSDLVNRAIKEFGIHKLGIEEEYLSFSEYEHYRSTLHVSLVPCQKKLAALRTVKEPWELERMRKAQQITDAAFSQLLPRIREGLSEKELAAELIYLLYRGGADGLSFAPIVVSGPNTSMPHGVPGERRLQPGDFITMDFGVIWQGYCSDMTRTVALGSVTDEMRHVYDTVLQAQLTGLAATRAGKCGWEIDKAARDVIEHAGFGPYFGHGYGHSLGLEIHESPNCSPSGRTPIPVGAVCSAEPGIYLPGRFGVRIEDVVIFTETGCEILTRSPKELIIL